MDTKEITPIQYADYSGYTLQGITKRLRNNQELEQVIEIKKYSRFYILIVPKSMSVNTIEQSRKNMAAKYPYTIT